MTERTTTGEGKLAEIVSYENHIATKKREMSYFINIFGPPKEWRHFFSAAQFLVHNKMSNASSFHHLHDVPINVSGKGYWLQLTSFRINLLSILTAAGESFRPETSYITLLTIWSINGRSPCAPMPLSIACSAILWKVLSACLCVGKNGN